MKQLTLCGCVMLTQVLNVFIILSCIWDIDNNNQQPTTVGVDVSFLCLQNVYADSSPPLSLLDNTNISKLNWANNWQNELLWKLPSERSLNFTLI